MTPIKPYPRKMGLVEQATALLPSYDLVLLAFSTDGTFDEDYEAAFAALEAAADARDADGTPELVAAYEAADARLGLLIQVGRARGILNSAERHFDHQVGAYTDDHGGVSIDGTIPMQLNLTVEGYTVYGRWRERSGLRTGLNIAPGADVFVPTHRIPERDYGLGDIPDSPRGTGPAEWRRLAALVVWGVRQHKASDACGADHPCCEVCDDCLIDVPAYAPRDPWVDAVPADNPEQRAADIAAYEIHHAQVAAFVRTRPSRSAEYARAGDPGGGGETAAVEGPGRVPPDRRAANAEWRAQLDTLHRAWAELSARDFVLDVDDDGDEFWRYVDAGDQ